MCMRIFKNCKLRARARLVISLAYLLVRRSSIHRNKERQWKRLCPHLPAQSHLIVLKVVRTHLTTAKKVLGKMHYLTGITRHLVISSKLSSHETAKLCHQLSGKDIKIPTLKSVNNPLVYLHLKTHLNLSKNLLLSNNLVINIK